VNWRKDFDAVKLAAGFGNPDLKPAGDETEEAKQRRKALKPWTSDILLHTGISNHLACFQNEGKTAAWAGNSPDIIQRHYKGLIKEADAREFWKLAPKEKKSKKSVPATPRTELGKAAADRCGLTEQCLSANVVGQ
jgi:hypothetical protein